MTRSIRLTMLLLPWSLTAVSVAFGEALPAAIPQTPSGGSSQTALYDPAQLPSFTEKVQQFTLTPKGDIDGIVLSDGTEVKTAPSLSTAIAYSIKLGDTVTVHGLHAAALPLIQAVSITDRASGRVIVDENAGPGPGRRPPTPGAAASRLAEEQGPVRMSLHGPRGEINGVLLTDGTVLRLPPGAAENLSALIQPGKTVIAQGNEISNPIGKVLEVRQIGATRDQLSPVAAPPQPGPRGREGPPRDGPPPPPPAASR